MQYRPLGNTGLNVSAIGVGTWAWGGMWGPRDDRESMAALEKAIALGVNCVDTALVYGDGHSETLVGNVLKRVKRRVYVATKIPPKNNEWPARAGSRLADAFPASWIIRCTERSLRHLGVERIDLQQLHVWTNSWLHATEWRTAVERLKRDGKIAHFGVSINDHEPNSALELVRSGWVETVQVIYNLFDQTPAETLLPLCQQQGVGVIARVPLDEGGLTGAFTPRTVFHKADWRRHYFAGKRLQETVARAEQLKTFFADRGMASLAQGALRFCLSHPAVSTVIPGMRRAAHVEDNVAAADQPPIDRATLAALTQHAWPRNFYAGIW